MHPTHRSRDIKNHIQTTAPAGATAGVTAALTATAVGWPAMVGAVVLVGLLLATLAWILADLARTARLISIINALRDQEHAQDANQDEASSEQ